WTGRIPAFITRALEALAGVGLRADWSALTSDLGRAASGTLIVDDGHSTHEFPAIAHASARAADIALLPHDEQTILITDRVSQVLAQQRAGCGRVGYLDSAGNAYLRGEGMIVEIAGQCMLVSAPSCMTIEQ